MVLELWWRWCNVLWTQDPSNTSPTRERYFSCAKFPENVHGFISQRHNLYCQCHSPCISLHPDLNYISLHKKYTWLNRNTHCLLQWDFRGMWGCEHNSHRALVAEVVQCESKCFYWKFLSCSFVAFRFILFHMKKVFYISCQFQELILSYFLLDMLRIYSYQLACLSKCVMS